MDPDSNIIVYIDNLLPFGTSVGDELVADVDDGSSRVITEFPFTYFGVTENAAVVSPWPEDSDL